MRTPRTGQPEPPAWHAFASGAAAGASGTLVGHAFDTAKVEAQIGRRLAVTNGVLPWLISLYRGILPPLISTGALRSLNFGLFERNKRWLHGGNADGCSKQTIFTAGCLAGLSLTPITSPIVSVKILQQAHGGSLPACVSNAWAGLPPHGLGFYRGFPLHAACETFGNGCYLLTYHLAKLTAQRWHGGDTLPLPVRIVCGALAGCAGWLSIYPLDVLRSQVISAGMVRLSPIAAASSTFRESGLRGFWRGIRMTLLRAAPMAGVVLPVYDVVLGALSRHKTA